MVDLCLGALECAEALLGQLASLLVLFRVPAVSSSDAANRIQERRTLELRMSSMTRRSYGAKPATSVTSSLTKADRFDCLPFRLTCFGATLRASVVLPRLRPHATSVHSQPQSAFVPVLSCGLDGCAKAAKDKGSAVRSFPTIHCQLPSSDASKTHSSSRRPTLLQRRELYRSRGPVGRLLVRTVA